MTQTLAEKELLQKVKIGYETIAVLVENLRFASTCKKVGDIHVIALALLTISREVAEAKSEFWQHTNNKSTTQTLADKIEILEHMREEFREASVNQIESEKKVYQYKNECAELHRRYSILGNEVAELEDKEMNKKTGRGRNDSDLGENG